MRQIPHFLATPGLLKPIRQQRRLIDHRHRIAEQDHRLILFRCSGVNLGAGLIVRGHTIEADPGCQRRLARTLGGFDIAGAKAAKTVRAFPAKQITEDKGLPWQQMESLALVLAAIEAEHVLEVAHNPVGRVQIPEQSPSRAMLQVIEMTLTGIAHIRPGHDPAVHNIPGKGSGAIRNTCPRCAFAHWGIARLGAARP